MIEMDPSWRDVFVGDDRAALAAYARPRPPFAGSSPALVVIDVTEAFVGPDVPVLVAQETSRQACGDRAWRALPAIGGLLRHFRSRSLPVVFTVPDSAQHWVGAATRGDASEPVLESGVMEGLEPDSGELTVTKAKASAFFGTPLLSGLIRNRCDTVVLVGGTTSGCVRATAVDGTSYGFEVLVAEDGCFDRAGLSHAVALAEIDAKYGRVMPADDIVTALNG